MGLKSWKKDNVFYKLHPLNWVGAKTQLYKPTISPKSPKRNNPLKAMYKESLFIWMLVYFLCGITWFSSPPLFWFNLVFIKKVVSFQVFSLSINLYELVSRGTGWHLHQHTLWRTFGSKKEEVASMLKRGMWAFNPVIQQQTLSIGTSRALSMQPMCIVRH